MITIDTSLFKAIYDKPSTHLESKSARKYRGLMLAEGIDGIKEIDMKFTNYVLFSHELQQKGLGYALDHTAKLGFEAVEWLDSALDESSIIPDMDAARATKN